MSSQGLARRSVHHSTSWVRRLIFLFVTVSAMMVGSIYLQTELSGLKRYIATGFVLQRIMISGGSHLSDKQIISTSQLHIGSPLWSIDLDALQQNLQGNNWIERVEIRRTYPHSIHINIKETTPQALWWHNEVCYLVSSSGGLLEKVSMPSAGALPYILLFGENAPVHYLALYKRLQTQTTHFISMAYVSQRRWDIYQENGTLVKLPANNPEEALNILDKLYATAIIDKSGVYDVDLRLLPEKIFIKRK